jgi:ribonuclease BN (tRNA processing enzyme)
MSYDRTQRLLTVLGCRAGSPGQGCAASGYLLTAGSQTILVDCGPGVVLELARPGLLATLDAVIITHRHADHCADLVALAYHRLFPTRITPLPLYGPPDVLEIVEGLDRLFCIDSLAELAQPLTTAFVFHAIEPGQSLDIAGLHVDTLRTLHPVPTLALRFCDVGWVYSSDGAFTQHLVHFARGAHILMAEATYLSADGHDLYGHGHMTAQQAGELARDAAVERLMLTHFADCSVTETSTEHARTMFSGPVIAAAPGLQIALATT